jgi:hypothetical protein
MKKNSYLLHLTVIVCFFEMITSCVDSQKLPLVSAYTVQVTMPDEMKDSYLYVNHIVTLRSQRITYTSYTNENGVAKFENIIPDIYDVYTSWDITGEEYVNMSDSLVENKPALISAIMPLNNIFSDSTINLKTLLTLKQSLLISKVYASGTRDLNNAAYTVDGYVEIFNNSDETQYIDGIYLALVEGDSPIAFAAKDNPTNIHARQVFQFPGNGKDYPILPGKSIVACNSAIDHTANATNTVNLQQADFEFKTIASKPTNNPAITAMTLIQTSYVGLNNLNLQRSSVNGICLFKTTDNVGTYTLDYPPGKTSGNKFLRIPAKYVFDGVEILAYRSTGVDPNSKRFQNFIDAGYKTISSTSGYTHESIERKVDTKRSNIVRVYLIDTNNSQNDMVTITDPTQKKYDKTLLLQ